MRKELIDILGQITSEEEAILKENKKIDEALYSVSDEFVADSYRMTGQKKLMQMRPHTRFVDFPQHRHDFIEMVYVCQGHNVNIVDGHEIDLQAGECLLINQYSVHEIKKAEKNDISVNFIILPEFFYQSQMMLKFKNVVSDFIINSLRGNNGKKEFLHFKTADIMPIQNLIENMIEMFVEKRENDIILQMTMSLLFQHFSMHLDRVNKDVIKQFGDILIEKSINYIETHYYDASLVELADKLHQTPSALSHLIREKTGHTFIGLVQEKRFRRALELLKSTGLSVNDIIASVGYENSSYFRRKFKEKYNMTPKQYRMAFSE